MKGKDPLARLVGEFSRLPGIGLKTAARMAHYILRVSRSDAEELSQAVLDVKDQLFHCKICNSITAIDPCSICTDQSRDRSVICVVEEPFNVQPIERTGEYRGLYHVLLGSLSPQRGVGPEEIAIESFMKRIDDIEEVILATNPNVEGEATALYLARLLQTWVTTNESRKQIRVTRLAFGMPIGGDIEFTDEVTLGRSLAGRRELWSQKLHS